MKWEVVELMGYAYFAEKGYRICVPLVQNSGYDFVAEKDGEFLRVNVKKAGLKVKGQFNSWSISQASGSLGKDFSSDSQCDVYLAYLPNVGRFIEIDGQFFKGCKSKSKTIPARLFLA